MRVHLQICQTLLAFFAQVLLPSSWRQPVIERVARQLLFAGVYAFPLLVLMGLGLGLIAENFGELWLDFTKRNDLLYPLIDIAVLTEIAPLLCVLFTVTANGAPMCAEMAMMRITREVSLLRALGVDAFTYLVMPRMLGLALACCCCSVVLSTFALGTASFGLSQAEGGASTLEIARRFLRELSPQDLGWMLLKAASGGLIVAAVACTVGLSAGDARTEVPRRVSQAMSQALTWVLGLWVILETGKWSSLRLANRFYDL